MADGKRLVLRGVNVAAYSDDETDSVEQMLRLTSEDDYRKIAAEGFNCVRLNLWATALRSEGGWEWLDQQRAWAASHSLYLILDMRAPPGGFQGPEYEGSFWSDPALQEHTIELWKETVRRINGDPTIYLFATSMAAIVVLSGSRGPALVARPPAE